MPAAARIDSPPRIGPDISLVGQHVEWLGSGSELTADVTVYLRCERETDEWWKVFLHGESPALPGRREIDDHTAVGDSYPSVVWRRGQIVVDQSRLRVGWILQALGGEGELLVAMGLFHDLTRAHVEPESAHDGENRVILGRYSTSEVPDDVVLDALPEGVTPLETPVHLDDTATLLAVEAEVSGRGSRAVAEVTLYLRAESRTDHPWRIFVHAVRGDRREVSDHHPVAGRVRTTRWEVGRIHVDRTLLDVGSMGRGPVEVFAGMFDPERRAEVDPPEADAGDRRVAVGELEVR